MSYVKLVVKHVQTDTGEVIETRLPIYNDYPGIGNDPNHPSWDAKY